MSVTCFNLNGNSQLGRYNDHYKLPDERLKTGLYFNLYMWYLPLIFLALFSLGKKYRGLLLWKATFYLAVMTLFSSIPLILIYPSVVTINVFLALIYSAFVSTFLFAFNKLATWAFVAKRKGGY